MGNGLKDLWDAIASLRARRQGANAGELQRRAVSAGAPTSNDLLGWNATTKKWEPKSSVPAARVYNSGALSHTSTGNWQVLTFDSERFDTDTIHDTSSNTSRLTATTGGKYIITGSVTWANNVTGRRILSILLNGSTRIGDQTLETENDVDLNMSVTTIYGLAAGDYVELQGWQNSGGTLAIQANSAYSPEFGMIRLGPTGSAVGAAGDDHGSLSGLTDDDHTQYLLVNGTRAGSTGSAQDFGSTGIKTDVIAESTAAAGVTADGVKLKDGEVDGVVVDAHAARHTDGSDDIQDATTAVKGIATFFTQDFTAGSGTVYVRDATIREAITDSGTAVGSTHQLNISGGTGITTACPAGNVITITGHVKYTAAEAIAAVEAEATLDLTGDVTIAATKALTTDTIHEKTPGAGITVDGLLIKDNFMEVEEIPTPANPALNNLRLFARASGDNIVLIARSSQGAEAVLATLDDTAGAHTNTLGLNWIE